MSRILIVGEDSLSCALGERLVGVGLPGWQLSGPSIDTKGVTKLVPALRRYVQLATHVNPVLCVADTDGQCALDLITQWLPPSATDRLVLRLAVTEAESWLLADREGFAEALHIPLNKLPTNPDLEPDPKRLLLNLAKKSRTRQIREEVVSNSDPNKQGTGYNLHLAAFVRNGWDARRAAESSTSLDRALRRLQVLGTRHD
jgi:hypothetical protein